MSYLVYALYSASLDILYIGQTSKLEKRLNDHRKGYSKFTSRTTDWQLIYSDTVISRSLAMKRERQLKTAKGLEFLRSFVKKDL
jgi:putative endonuclease